MKGSGVILVTRLNGSQFYINAEMIQVVESTPDTVISLTSETKVVVKENSEEVIRRIIEYRRLILGTPIIKQKGSRQGA
jgi:flagellar protein FlbD